MAGEKTILITGATGRRGGACCGTYRARVSSCVRRHVSRTVTRPWRWQSRAWKS